MADERAVFDLLALETARKIEQAFAQRYLGGAPQRQAAIQIIVSAAIELAVNMSRQTEIEQ